MTGGVWCSEGTRGYPSLREGCAFLMYSTQHRNTANGSCSILEPVAKSQPYQAHSSLSSHVLSQPLLKLLPLYATMYNTSTPVASHTTAPAALYAPPLWQRTPHAPPSFSMFNRPRQVPPHADMPVQLSLHHQAPSNGSERKIRQLKLVVLQVHSPCLRATKR